MNLLKHFCTVFTILCSLAIAAQHQPEVPASATIKDKFEAGFDGMLAVSYGSKAMGGKRRRPEPEV